MQKYLYLSAAVLICVTGYGDLRCILCDIKNGKRKVINFNSFSNKDSDAILKAHLFDTFTQIRKK